MHLFTSSALLPDGWADHVRIEIDDTGRISAIVTDTEPRAVDYLLRHHGLIPAPGNLHSHAFQRAMAGMTEVNRGGKNSFWTWRDLMYRFLAHIEPDDLAAIAALVYMEMLEAGYASVGEFHYLHHQPDGTAYDDPGTMCAALAEAGAETGIGLTLLPVLYATGGLDGRAPAGGQMRFANDLSRFSALLDSAGHHLTHLPDDTVLGVAPHSLRAVPADMLAEVPTLRPDMPIHIHIAEQMAEIREVEAHTGTRPVRWLLDNAPVDDRWCLVHATHMDADETRDMAHSGAIAGLCPITEGNLGDGIFNGAAYLGHDGQYGIGSDSNIRISLCEELRMLEYSQRLQQQARNVMIAGDGSTGEALLLAAAAGGARALKRGRGRIAVGEWADFSAFDTRTLAFAGLKRDQWLDGFIFAGDDRVMTDVWSAGRHCVRNGQHVNRARILTRYRQTMTRLVEHL